METKIQKLSSIVKNYNFVIYASSFLLLWFISFYPAISSAAKIWAGNEIFNHGFFILPGALYLIYQKRAELVQTSIKPNYWIGLILLSIVLTYQFGFIGNINLFMHFAAFSFVPFAIWFCFGNQFVNKIKFPLFFVVFSIPVGEQLIPYLQEITTDLAMPLLHLAQVPIFRSGLYLEIPQGQFLVAEACSGISFFVGSIVFGSLYTYLTFNTLKNRLLFMLIVLILPILANAIRVFGIVYIAYLTDMEYAAGADHIIYGWVFYLIVLFLLISVGELWKKYFEHSSKIENSTSHVQYSKAQSPKYSIYFLTILMAFVMFANETFENKESQYEFPYRKIDSYLSIEHQLLWQPDFKFPNFEFRGKVKDSSTNVYIAAYDVNNNNGELISYLNRLFSDKRWTLISTAVIDVTSQYKAKQLIVTSKSGSKRQIVYIYKVGDYYFYSESKAKLYSTFLKMLNVNSDRIIIAISSENSSELNSLSQKLTQVLTVLK